MMTTGRRRSSILVGSVLSLLTFANFMLPTLFRVTVPSASNAEYYLNTGTFDHSTTSNTENVNATNNNNHLGSITIPPLVTTKTTVKGSTSKPFEDELTWKIDVPSHGGFRDLPVYVICKWYGSGRHKRLTKKTNGARTVSTKGKAELPANVALPSSGNMRIVVDHPCKALLKDHQCGLGNWVLQTYLLRMAAMHTVQAHSKAFSVTRISHLQMTCKDMNQNNREQLQKTLVLPWLMGNFSGPQDLAEAENYWKSSAAAVKETIPTQCFRNFGDWAGSPILYMLPFIRQDLRRLAVNLVGPPPDNPDHPAHAYLQTMLQLEPHPKHNNISLLTSHFQPLLTNVQLDDVAIHFRCGDIMAGSTKGVTSFHFIKFRSFADLIPVETVRSIGIVTQPFPKQQKSNIQKVDPQARWRDVHDNFGAQLCARVSLSFQQYLRERFPEARVSIRNGPGESIALAYARLVMAQYAFAAPDSTFSLFPVLATFGKGYHIEADLNRGMNRGVTRDRALVDDDPHVFFMKAKAKLPVATTIQLRIANETMAREEILKWFRLDDYSITFNMTEYTTSNT